MEGMVGKNVAKEGRDKVRRDRETVKAGEDRF
jgi:hypothetical protein